MSLKRMTKYRQSVKILFVSNTDTTRTNSIGMYAIKTVNMFKIFKLVD